MDSILYTPNIFAEAVFFLYVVVALLVMRHYRTRPALSIGIPLFAAIMFLPQIVSFKVPGVPAFTKESVATFWAAVGVFVWHRHRMREVRLSLAMRLLFIAVPIAALGTAMTNKDTHVIGGTVLSGLTTWDGVHLAINDFFLLLLPFLLGAAVFRTRRDMRDLLMLVAGAALVYAPFILLEARLSPQLHNWIYGFYQHDFGQTIRWGGFRPMVFMNHGLAVALFVASGLVAAMSLRRAGLSVGRIRSGRVVLFLGWLLLVCKTISSMLYGYAGAAFALLGLPRVQIKVAFILVAFLFVYPVLRYHDMVPTDSWIRTANEWTDAERAQSFEFRLANEEVLFERAMERPVFGWGGFSRASVYDTYNGNELSVRDGAWIIVFGERGFAGYVLFFGLIAAAMFVARDQLRKVRPGADRALLSAVALLVGISTFDFIPNGRFSYFGHLLAGGLFGLSMGLPAELVKERIQRRQREWRAKAAATPPKVLVPLDEQAAARGTQS